MVVRLRQFFLVLIAFAVIGGQSSQLARSAETMTTMAAAGMPCDMMMPHRAADHDNQMPCKGLTPDCIKQMGCIVDAALPARFVAVTPAVHSGEVAYWPARSSLADFVRDPEALPPRTT
jgi:hypothetical protein